MPKDLVQETSVRIWEQFSEYRTGTDFGAWGCAIARYMVLAYRKRQQRGRLQFSPEVIRQVAVELDSAASIQHDRLQALANCLQKCDDRNRNLLRVCYDKRSQIKDVAQRLGRSLNSIYMALSRLRRVLHDCVEGELRRKVAE